MKNIKLKFNKLITTSAFFLINASSTFAAFWIDETVRPQWAGSWSFKSTFMSVLNYFLWFLWLLALVMIIYAGVKIVVSDEKEVANARQQIIYAIVWLVVVILSYSIVRIVSDIPTT